MLSALPGGGRRRRDARDGRGLLRPGHAMTVTGTASAPATRSSSRARRCSCRVRGDRVGSLTDRQGAEQRRVHRARRRSSFTLKATDQRRATSTPASSFDVANLTFATSGGVRSPASKRAWNFSGFIQKPGKPIYGHFRNGGRTYANYRFGVPKGRCGTLQEARAGHPRRRSSRPASG